MSVRCCVIRVSEWVLNLSVLLALAGIAYGLVFAGKQLQAWRALEVRSQYLEHLDRLVEDRAVFKKIIGDEEYSSRDVDRERAVFLMSRTAGIYASTYGQMEKGAFGYRDEIDRDLCRLMAYPAFKDFFSTNIFRNEDADLNLRRAAAKCLGKSLRNP